MDSQLVTRTFADQQRRPLGRLGESDMASSRARSSIAAEVGRQSRGIPLDVATRALFEPTFGHDFSRVRVHADRAAAHAAKAIDASAYTVGRDIVFGEGMYNPRTPRGLSLLAHELTHVAQQRLIDRPAR
jgi:hypothetical protein